MTIYTAALACNTKAGGVSKPARLWIQTEANSREEALVRMRSAAARVLSKPGTKDIGDHLFTVDGSGSFEGHLIPRQSPFTEVVGDASAFTVTVGSVTEEIEQATIGEHEAIEPIASRHLV